MTVVIPAYNAEAFIGETVASCLAQSWTALEVVVVDDGSKTPVEEALSGCDKQVRVMRKSNGGVASARNAGLREARGALVQFLDADDTLRPDAIERKMEALRCVPDAELAFSGRVMVGENAFKRSDSDVTRPIGSLECPTQDLLWAAVRGYPFHTSTVLLARALALEVGGMDESLLRCEDRRFCFQIGAVGAKAVAVDLPLTTRRLHEDGLTNDLAAMDCHGVVVALMNLRDLLLHPSLWCYLDASKSRLRGEARASILADPSQERVRELWDEVVEAVQQLAERGREHGLSAAPCVASLRALVDSSKRGGCGVVEEWLAEAIEQAQREAPMPSPRDIDLWLTCPPVTKKKGLEFLYTWTHRTFHARPSVTLLDALPRLIAHWPEHPYRERWEPVLRWRSRVGDRLTVGWLSADRFRWPGIRRIRMRLKLRTRLNALLGARS